MTSNGSELIKRPGRREILHHTTSEINRTDKSGEKLCHIVENLVSYSSTTTNLICKFYEKKNECVTKIIIRISENESEYAVTIKTCDGTCIANDCDTQKLTYNKDDLVAWLNTDERLGFMIEYIDKL